MNTKEKVGLWSIGLVCGLVVLILSQQNPIAQPLEYHQFSDQRILLGMTNFLNVMSNLVFLGVGGYALFLLKYNKLKILTENTLSYQIFFSGVALVALGSAYYHYQPNNQTLVWDRLPMTIAFMALISVIITEFVSSKLAKMSLFPLIIMGFLSVIYWYVTELNGQGDLRLYVLVQFLPMIGIPLVLLTFRHKFEQIHGYWWLLACYLLAKFFENFDAQVQDFLQGISGHSIKHLVAALGVYLLLRHYKTRELSRE